MACNASYNHPAYYFHAAATYASLRKKKAIEIADRIGMETVEKFGPLPPLHLASVDISKQQFTGQLPVDQSDFEENGELSLTDWTRAKRAAREFYFPHSRCIIDLLQKSHSLYSTRSISGSQKGSGPCRRMKLFLIYDIAEESFASGNFTHAKEYVTYPSNPCFLMTLFRYFDILRNSVIRTEEWKLIYSTILKRSLDCALQLKQTKDLIDNGLKLCEPQIPLSVHNKETIQSQLVFTMSHLDQFSLPTLADPHQIIINQSKHPLMQVNCHFDQRNVHTNNPLVFRVQCISSFPLPVRFQSLRIRFTDDTYNVIITDDGPPIAGGEAAAATTENLVVLPHIPRVVEFTKTAQHICDLEVCILIMSRRMLKKTI